jgi:uncharacterized protein YjbJ (UPF0337 family)
MKSSQWLPVTQDCLLLWRDFSTEKQRSETMEPSIKEGKLYERKGEVGENGGQVMNNSNLATEGKNGKVQQKIGQIDKALEQ